MAVADERGASLPDLLVAAALAALVSATTLPVVAGALEHERATLAARFVAGRAEHARLESLRRNAYVAIRIRPVGDDLEIQPFVDGNGNGVLARDVERGIDPPIEPPDRLGWHVRDVTARVNQPIPDIGSGGWIETGGDPVRLGRSELLSFGPTGSCSSGTVYLAARRGPQLAVRLTGTTGRVRVLRYDAGARAWLP